MARTFEFVLHFVGCVTVTVSPNQIIIIIIIIIIITYRQVQAIMFIIGSLDFGLAILLYVYPRTFSIIVKFSDPKIRGHSFIA